ncbi:MAG: hypothetical protein NXI04_21935 [Planctomycetaceae bacterium]|nr:hypothetical protein [Planctomycetaceae bacterium]
MASPFTFFRKYSSGMMIVMVILSMLLFTLTDLFSDPSAKFWLLGLLIGGAVFGVAGISQGKWLQWGLGGSVLGVLLGLILPSFAESGGIATNVGVVTQEEQNDMYMRRAIANRFLAGAIEQTYGPMFFQFQAPPRFGFRQRTETEDLIFGKLMRAEADRLGLEVTPTMVKEYLTNMTDGQLTKSDYLTIRNSLSYNGQTLTEELASEILGDEIRARMAYDLTMPFRATVPPSPEVYWEYYKRLKVQQDLELVAVDVEEFAGQIAEPSDGDIASLFDEYKTSMPNQQEAGAPGFFLPTRIKVAYAELDNEKLKSAIEPVTEEDIKKYYEDNKESPLIRIPVFPDIEGTDTSDVEAEEPQTEAPQSEEPQTEEPQTEEPQSEEPQTEEPQTEEPQTEEPQSEEPQTEEPDDCGVFQDETPQNSDEPVEPPATKEPEPPEVPATESTEPATSGAETTPESQDGEAPVTDDSQSPNGEIEGEGTPPLSLEIPEKPVGTTPPEMPEPTYEYRELDEELSGEIREAIEAERIDALTNQRLADLKSEMEGIARERDKQQFGIIEADSAKYEVGNDGDKSAYDDLRNEMRALEVEYNKTLKAAAEAAGFAYVETGLLSYADFVDGEDYPIALATEPVDNPMMAPQASTVAQTLFQNFNQDSQNNNAQLYLARQAQKTDIALTGGTSYYVYWAIDYDKSHEPKLDEPGVRDAVIAAYKLGKARDLAKTRAEELAARIRAVVDAEGTEEQGFAEILKDETSTGAEDGSALAPRRTLPFSWMKTSSAGQMGMQQQATMSTIEFRDESGGFMDDVGGKFMESVFTELSDDEVGVVPNYDLSKYYVVHVQNRFPTAEVGEDGLRDQFAAEGKQFSFRNSAILTPIQQDLAMTALRKWELSVWEKYGVIEAQPETE